MSTVTEAFDAAARELLKEEWAKRHAVDPETGHIKHWLEPRYPASLTRFIEVEIDGVPMTFALRIKPVK